MAQTLTTIQTLARDYARFDGYTITSGTNLTRANQIYRKLQTLALWAELEATDTSLSVADGTETYSWPVVVTFLREPSIRIQQPGGKYKVVHPVPSEQLWAELGRRSNGVPLHYRRGSAASVLQISFRPVPNFAGTVEMTGSSAAPALNGAGSTTVFQNEVVDDAFAIWLAAIESDKKGFSQRAASLFAQAASLLSEVTGRSIGAADLGLTLSA